MYVPGQLIFKCTRIRWVHNHLTRALALITSSLNTKGFLSNWTKFSLLEKKEKEYNFRFSTYHKRCNSKSEKKKVTVKTGFNNMPLTNTKFCCSLFCGKCSLNGINVSLGRLIDKNTQMFGHKIMPCTVIFGPFKH